MEMEKKIVNIRRCAEHRDIVETKATEMEKKIVNIRRCAELGLVTHDEAESLVAECRSFFADWEKRMKS